MARVDNRRYSDEDIEEVKRLNPLEDVVPEYGVALRPEGRTFKGLCPFHADVHTPNLTVFPETRSWCCFACPGRPTGDVIEFVRRKTGLSFRDAVEQLRTRRPGMVSPQPPSAVIHQQKAPAIRRQWDRLSLEEQLVMNTARLVYQDALWHNQDALAYLRERGLPHWAIRQCGLGYADGHSLELFLRRRSGLRVAERLGLLRRSQAEARGASYREPLAGRVVVPELRGGQCIWFIGRALESDADRPKYVALPGERPVLGFERAVGRREAFVCEGVFDYLTAVVWGLAACSFCGTQLPDDRLGFLASAQVVYGLFDGDDAGQMAASRAEEQLAGRFRPVQLPDGSDLNDLGSRPDGRPLFFQLLATARSAGHGPVPRESLSAMCDQEVSLAHRY
ncbi:MAG: toprim domain-containing protein [Chloroflexota bacterium]|nr:toprim domain-containing protein [Chloroflexota bacterium]